MKSKRENIAEYILYLWQIEDYLRAFPEKAEESAELKEYLDMMHQEGIMERGHLQLAENALSELEELSMELEAEEATYRAALIRMTPALNLLKAKTDDPTMSHLRAAFVLLYQVMLLRIQQKPITPETEATIKEVTNWLRYLSKTYLENYDAEGEV